MTCCHSSSAFINILNKITQFNKSNLRYFKKELEIVEPKFTCTIPDKQASMHAPQFGT